MIHEYYMNGEDPDEYEALNIFRKSGALQIYGCRIIANVMVYSLYLQIIYKHITENHVTILMFYGIFVNNNRDIFLQIRPDIPYIIYMWYDTPPEHISQSIDNILSRITRLGHHSSLVSCHIIQKCTKKPKHNTRPKRKQ